jgi:hypothetical protein
MPLPSYFVPDLKFSMSNVFVDYLFLILWIEGNRSWLCTRMIYFWAYVCPKFVLTLMSYYYCLNMKEWFLITWENSASSFESPTKKDGLNKLLSVRYCKLYAFLLPQRKFINYKKRRKENTCSANILSLSKLLSKEIMHSYYCFHVYIYV